MILRVPSYYKTFQCIADKCEHSCCIGWEIDIDEDSYDYYMGIEGAFGERLKEQKMRNTALYYGKTAGAHF